MAFRGGSRLRTYLGRSYLGVLIIRIPVFRVQYYIKVPYFGKPPGGRHKDEFTRLTRFRVLGLGLRVFETSWGFEFSDSGYLEWDSP